MPAPTKGKAAEPQQPLILEYLDTSDKVGTFADPSIKRLRVISANEAFRKFDWARKAPVLNKSGDLRGMVISARWRTAFTFVSKWGEPVGRVALFVGIAANLAKAAPEIEAIYQSKDNAYIKGARLVAQADSVAARTVAGIVPAGTHILARTIIFSCGMVGAGFSGLSNSMDECILSLDKLDTSFNSAFDTVTDGDNIYWFVTTQLQFAPDAY